MSLTEAEKEKHTRLEHVLGYSLMNRDICNNFALTYIQGYTCIECCTQSQIIFILANYQKIEFVL